MRATLEQNAPLTIAAGPLWVSRAGVLWKHRHTIARVTAISAFVSLALAIAIPNEYKSTASILPPENGSSAMMLAALVSRAPGLGALGGLANSVLGGRTSSDLFIDLLRSSTVSGDLIDRFNLQHVYHKRYRVDAAKHLAHCTKITEDKKSGVITIAVEDKSRERARDLAQGYLDELNKLVARTNTSAAHQERVFIEQRLQAARVDLEQAELDLSQFSSKNNTIDIKEQTRAMVDSGARVQAELLVEQSGLQSLRQIYGDGNVRVRETEARIASLQNDLKKMAGSSEAPVAAMIDDQGNAAKDDSGEIYPPLRQLPRLAVPFADLYRRVRVQESVFELLTQQYEMARIEEAKEIPVISVIDSPGLPEKKSSPHRLLLTLLLTFLSFGITSAVILAREHWASIDVRDPRKALAGEVLPVVRRRYRSINPFRRGAA